MRGGLNPSTIAYRETHSKEGSMLRALGKRVNKQSYITKQSTESKDDP